MLGDVFDVLFLLEDRPARGTGPVLLVEITQRDADRPNHRQRMHPGVFKTGRAR